MEEVEEWRGEDDGDVDRKRLGRGLKVETGFGISRVPAASLYTVSHLREARSRQRGMPSFTSPL
jgi:hypothetical protein